MINLTRRLASIALLSGSICMGGCAGSTGESMYERSTSTGSWREVSTAPIESLTRPLNYFRRLDGRYFASNDVAGQTIYEPLCVIVYAKVVPSDRDDQQFTVSPGYFDDSVEVARISRGSEEFGNLSGRVHQALLDVVASARWHRTDQLPGMIYWEPEKITGLAEIQVSMKCKDGFGVDAERGVIHVIGVYAPKTRNDEGQAVVEQVLCGFLNEWNPEWVYLADPPASRKFLAALESVQAAATRG